MNFLLSLRRYLRHPVRLVVGAITLLTIYLIAFGSEVLESLNYPDILIAPIMALGSFVAGATFLGGGAVAFPALTKILGTDPQTAKTFSFAIQSIGMTSASIYILTRIPVLPVLFIAVYILSACIGLIFSLFYFQDILLPNDIRIGFTIFVLCFFCIYLWVQQHTNESPTLKNQQSVFTHSNIYWSFRTVSVTIICALLGGIVSGLIGSGADLFAFCLLTLFFRLDIKLATQLSVIVMAALSIAGISLEITLHNSLPQEVINLWVIAAPVVLFGAPLGALFCRRINPNSLKIFIACIVAIEVISTFMLVDVEHGRRTIYLIGLICGFLFLSSVYFLSPYRRET